MEGLDKKRKTGAHAAQLGYNLQARLQLAVVGQFGLSRIQDSFGRPGRRDKERC